MAIDFDKIRVPKDKKIQVTPVLATITVGRPGKTEFIRTRTGDGFEPMELYTYSPGGSGKDSTTYLVMPPCQALLEEMGLLVPAKFCLYMVYGSKILKIDYISQKLNKNGSLSTFHTTHMAAMEAATKQWVRMHSNIEGGFYSWSLAEDILPDPEWPAKPANLREALEIAFKDCVLDSLEHPEIKKLRGKL